MEKKILFMSSAKLTALSFGLLLAVFCTIGMSFTPGEEGENVGNPNDSTYVPGPRHSHYHQDKSGCNSEVNHGVLDYGEATAVTTGGGTVTISSPSGGGTVTSGNNTTSGSTNGNQVVLKWNCGSTATNASNTSEAAHKRVIRFVATPDANHNFKGWSTTTSANNIFNEGTPYDEEMVIDDWNKNNGSHESEANAVKIKYYAIFAEKVKVTLLFANSEGGSYTYAGKNIDGTANNGSMGGSITTYDAVTLTAAPASGYKFFGWYTLNGQTEEFFSTSPTVNKAFDANTTIYAKFLPSNTALFEIKGGDGTTYYDLNDACTAALSSSSKVVVPTANGTLYAGTYTIPSGVTLLVPYDAGYTLQEASVKQSTATKVSPTVYRTLTLASGVILNISGKLNIGGTQNIANQHNSGQGVPDGKYGELVMLNGSRITLNGATMYAWGFVSGAGEITAKTGSTVYEGFMVMDYKGGSITTTMTDAKIFPLSQYYIQNIQVPITFEYGAVEKAVTGMTASIFSPSATVNLIGNSGSLFTLNSGATVRKEYDTSKDRQVYTINGNASLNDISLSLTGIMTVNSNEYILPITNNMTVNVNSGTTTINCNGIELSADAEINIAEDANVVIASGKKVAVMDLDNWGNYPGGAYIYPLKDAYAPHRAYSRTKSNMSDAKIYVKGKLTAIGGLYTSPAGAHIYSDNNAKGQIYLQNAAPTTALTVKHRTGTSNTSLVNADVNCTAAKLHNADGSYLATSGAAANTTITYANGHWGWIAIWKDYDGTILKVANTCLESQLAANAPADPTRDPDSDCVASYTFNGWTASRDATLQEIIYTAEYSSESKKYTVTWKNADGTVLETDTDVPCGSQSSYDAATTPIKAADAQYTYTFDGWATEKNGDKDYEIGATPTVSGAATYYAHFAQTTNAYTVTWQNADGTTLETDENVPYGTTPSYNGATPTKTATNENTYTFTGWNSEIAPVTDNATYTAQFSEEMRVYTITWKNINDTVLTTTTNYWGREPAYPPFNGTPTYTDSEHHVYHFEGWDPVIHEVNSDDNVYTAKYRIISDLYVSEEQTIKEESTVTTTTVHVAGRLVLKAPLNTNDLILEATPSSSGTISGIEKIAVNSKAYFDYEFDVEPWHWSAFGVPFVIDLKEAAPLKEKETELALGTDYDIIYYNTNKRAEQGPGSHCWEYVDHQAEHKLIPGVQYMIAFNKPKGHVNTVRFTKAETASINYDGILNLVTTGEAAGDNNWNGIANPKMYHALLDAGVTECQVHDGGEIGKDGYYTYVMSDMKFFVGKSAFVQVPSGKKSVVITEATTQDAIQQFHAPRRAKLTASEGTRYDVQIAPSEEDAADRLLVLADEDKADEYVIVSDLAKAGVSPVRAQMWVDRYGEKLCKNTTSFINNKADYPIVISTPKAGEYDIFINDQPDDETMLYLTYDGEAIWNLSYGGYIVNLEKGTNTHYGLRIVRTPKITTGIEETSIRNGDAIRKVLVNDQVFIIRGENVYTIDGQMVK